MKKIDFIWILLSFFVGLIAYLTSMQFILALVLALIYIFYYFIFARKKFKKYLFKIERVHCCYHFINSFLVTMSVKESFEDAYQSGIRINNKHLNEETKFLEKLNVVDRIRYLRGYFDLAIYKIFLNILDLYQDQGGKILSMSDQLMKECMRIEKTLNETLAIGRKHIFEFIILWIMSFGIVLFMRFGISEFYVMMASEPLFVIMLFLFFLICLVSVHLFVSQYTNLTIKEDKE